MNYKYYHQRRTKTLNFIIPKNKKILILGSYDGQALSNLSPIKGVGVEAEEKFYRIAKKRYPKLRFVNENYENFKTTEKFDYIILNGALGKTADMLRLLRNISHSCHSTTRIVVYQHNYLWQWFLGFLEKINLKRKEGIQNWLSIGDLKAYLEGAGYEITRIFKRTLVPVHFFGIGSFINQVGYLVPIFDFVKLDQYIIARPEPKLFSAKSPSSLTICLTVRNEKGNIEKIVRSIPQITANQEILFVEGHSTDGTKEEIERVIKAYPKKKIRVIGQPKKGQGDAIRVGFKDAKGDIVILFEGDGTSDVNDIQYFYEALKSGRFEFIEGSRFVYPIDSKAMPLINRVGNIAFATWFSFFLGQRVTDVLSGIKGMLKKDYDLLYERWGFLKIEDPFGDFELLYGAARMGLKFGEIPMRYYPRTYGQTKTKVFTHGPFLINMAAKGYWLFRRN